MSLSVSGVGSINGLTPDWLSKRGGPQKNQNDVAAFGIALHLRRCLINYTDYIMITKRILTFAAIFAFCSGASAIQAGVIKGTIPVSAAINGNATSTAITKSFTIFQKGDSVNRVVITTTTTYPGGATYTETESYGLSRTSFGGTVAYTYPDGSGGSYADGGPAVVRLKTKKKRGRVNGGTCSIVLMDSYSNTSMYGSSSGTDTRRIIASVGKKSGLSYTRTETDTSGGMTTTYTESGKGKAKGKIK